MIHVLITGADGYLGLRLVQAFLQDDNTAVTAWLRSSDEREFSEKVAKMRLTLASQRLDSDRLVFATGDLRADEPFKQVDSRDLRCIIHSAAVTRFNVEEDVADSVNTQGSRKLFAFAETCPQLERLVYVSTAFASGLRVGPISESALDNTAGFANHYERSKWQAECALINEFNHLPWIIARVATVLADNDDGQVTQYNVVHNTLKLLYYGLISLVPGDSDVPLYFVTGEFVTDALLALVRQPAGQHKFYHLVHERSEMPTVGDFIDVVYEVFQGDKDFVSRQVLKPMLIDEPSFAVLAEQLNSFSGGIVQQAIQSMVPFAKQLYVEKEFSNQALRSCLGDRYRPFVARTCLQRTMETLVRTKWGRK